MPITHEPSTTHDDVHEIPALLETLRNTRPPEGGVLSVYIGTPLMAVAGRTYLVSFREGCKSLRASVAPEALDRFDDVVARADQHLAEAFVPRLPGLALFAATEADYFFAVPLPGRPAEEFSWGPRPVLAPLEELLDEYERVAVALFDQRDARLYTVYLGAIEERSVVESNVPGQHATGRWGGMARTEYTGQRGAGRGPRGGGMAAARYARHREDAIQEHVRDTVHALMELLRSRPFDRLLLAGSAEATARLRNGLARPLRARLADEIVLPASASDAEVLQAALTAAEAAERRAEVEMVDALLAAAGTPRAAVGFDATLAALSEDRVRQLFVADTFMGVGSECPACGRLVAGPGPCPVCGTQTTPLGDLRERLTNRAIEQGARVEFVSGDAAALLMVSGGLGAWTRY